VGCGQVGCGQYEIFHTLSLVLIDCTGQTAIRRLVEFLKDPYRGVCLTAITMLSRLGVRGMDYIAAFLFNVLEVVCS